jgi:hypothetical protein
MEPPPTLGMIDIDMDWSTWFALFSPTTDFKIYFVNFGAGKSFIGSPPLISEILTFSMWI